MATLYRYKETPLERIARKIKEGKMGDKLQELYQEFADTNAEASFSSYQAGFSRSAQSMRARALELVQKYNRMGKLNDLINAIGSLPDIPTE